MVSDILALQKVLTKMPQKSAKNQVKVGLVGMREVLHDIVKPVRKTVGILEMRGKGTG